MNDRRDWIADALRAGLLLAAAGAWPGTARAAFDSRALTATSVRAALEALGLAEPVRSDALKIDAPEIADNGTTVPIGLSATDPGVNRFVLLVERNPTIPVASFEFDGQVEPEVLLRIRMAETSDVWLIATTTDGRTLYTRRNVQVVLGGCGG